MAEATGSVSFFDGNDQQGSGGQNRQSADEGISENPGRETPKKWKGAKDVRESEDSGDYPNYSSWKTRSGHSIMLDDTEGKESLTIQHRSGSALQMLPNGAIHMVANHGSYHVIFGEKRMIVTGAGDITYKGDSSIRTYGDVNHTHHGDYNLTVTGDHNITAKNKNVTVRGNYDMIAQNYTGKFEGNHAIHAGGAMAHVAHKDVTVASVSRSLFHGAHSGIHQAVRKGNFSVSVLEEGDFIKYNEKGNDLTKLNKGSEHKEITGSKFVTIKSNSPGGEYHIHADKSVKMTSMDAIDIKSSKDFSMSSGQSFHVDAAQSLFASAGQDSHFDSGQSAYMSASQSLHHKAGQSINGDAMTQKHQSGSAQKANKSQKAQQAEKAQPQDPNPQSKGGIKTQPEQAIKKFGSPQLA